MNSIKVRGVKNLENLISAVSNKQPVVILVRPVEMVAMFNEDYNKLEFEVEPYFVAYSDYEVRTDSRYLSVEFTGIEAFAQFIASTSSMSGNYNYAIFVDAEGAQKPANERYGSIDISPYNKDSRFTMEFY